MCSLKMTFDVCVRFSPFFFSIDKLKNLFWSFAITLKHALSVICTLCLWFCRLPHLSHTMPSPSLLWPWSSACHMALRIQLFCFCFTEEKCAILCCVVKNQQSETMSKLCLSFVSALSLSLFLILLPFFFIILPFLSQSNKQQTNKEREREKCGVQ